MTDPFVSLLDDSLGDGNYCLTGSYDRTIRLWNPHKEKEIRSYLGHGFQVLDLDIARDNNNFISCGEDKQAYYWDVEKAVILRKYYGHSHRINCIKFNKDCQVFASGSFDKTVRIWDGRSRSIQAIQVLDHAYDSVSSLVFSNFELTTASIDGCVRVYDLRMGEIKVDTIGHPVTSLSLSIDGNILLASSLDAKLRLIDKDDGSVYKEYSGHQNSDFKLENTFSNDDAYVISGSEDGKIYFWSLEEGSVVQCLRAHDKMVTGVSYHPLQPYLLSVSADCTMKLWGRPTV